MIINVFIDESGKHGGSPHMIMAGYAGALGQWCEFDKKFERLLKRYGLTYFHAKELNGGENEFKGWSRERKIEFGEALTKIISRHTAFGFSVLVRHDDYRDHYVAGYRPKKIQLDSHYGICFRIVMSWLPQAIRKAYADKNIRVRLILEAGHENAPDIERLFRLFKQIEPPEESAPFESLEFAAKKRFPGLQAADSVAWGAFRQEQIETEFLEIPRSLSFAETRKMAPQKSPIFRLEGTPPILSELKDNVLAQIKAREDHFKRRAL